MFTRLSLPQKIVGSIIVLGVLFGGSYGGYKWWTAAKTQQETTQPASPNPPAANPANTAGSPAANPPATAPAVVNPVPPPIARATDAIGDLIEDMHWYKENEVGDFLVSSQAPPFQIQLPAASFKEADKEIFKASAQEEINRPKDKKRKVTDLIAVRLTLDATGSRFESALVLFNGVDGANQPLHPAGTSAVRVVFDSNVWTSEHSVAFARQLRQGLHDTLGLPDRGGVRQQPVLIRPDPLLNLTDR